MCFNCTGKRSFSKPKWIKNEIRSSSLNQCLTHLSVMSIESKLLRKLNFDKLFHEVSYKKYRYVRYKLCECPTWPCIVVYITGFFHSTASSKSY